MDHLKNRLITAYDLQAEQRDLAERQPWKLQERAEFLRALHDRGLHTLLELGAGPGHDAKFFQDSGLEVTCIDLSPNMVSLCQDKGLRAQVMDFADLAFPDDSFDAIWALNCLLHVPKAELPNVLAGIRRVLKPGGLFYMGVYGGRNSEGVWEDDSYEPKRFFSFFDEAELREVVSQFLTPMKSSTLPHSETLRFLSFTCMN